MPAASPPPPTPGGSSGKVVRLDSSKRPIPSQPPTQSKLAKKKQSRAQRVAASNECQNPDCHDKDVGPEDGQLVCRGCGTVVNDSNMVSEVVFGASGNGATLLHGAHIAADQTFARSTGARLHGGSAMNSRDITEATGRRYLNQLGAALTISQSLIDAGMQIFKLAAANNFIQGRRTKSVTAVCLYIACRLQKDTNRNMLIDFSDILMLNVFHLGRIYKDLIKELRLNGNGFIVQPINPEDLLLRFANRLEFGEDTMRVANEAVRIVQRMDRDWMTPGRRPAGICGAALILAARMNNYRRSIREMAIIVKVAEVTIQKRLEEFLVTESSSLTVEEFRTVDLEGACDPPAFYEQKGTKRKTRKRKLIEIEDDDSSGTESRRAQSSAPPNGEKQKESTAVSEQGQTDNRSMPPPPVPIDPTLIQVSAQRLSELQSSSSNKSSATRENTEHLAKRRRRSNESSPIRETTEHPAKRRRGSNESSTTNEDTEQPAKRKRGSNESYTNNEDTEQPAKRKRGRPRKTPNPPSTTANPTPELDLTSLLSAPSDFVSARAFSRALSSSSIESAAESTVPPPPTKLRRPIPSDPDISDSEFASDPEVADCVLSTAEQAVKERIWTHENADYLREQHTKMLKRKLEEADGTARTVVKRIRRRGRMGDMSAYRDGEDGEDGPVASTPGEAAMKMLRRRGYSKKINYETFKGMYQLRAASTANSNKTTSSNTPHPPAKTPTPDPSRARSSSPLPKSPRSVAAKINAPAPAISPSTSATALPARSDIDTDDEHEEGDPDFWAEGELERAQEAIDQGLDSDDEDDDGEIEEEIFDEGSGEEFG